MTPPRATLDAHEVAAVWGISSWAVYDLAKKHGLPVAPLTFGRTLRWPAVAVAASVGIDVADLIEHRANGKAPPDDEGPGPIVPDLATNSNATTNASPKERVT